LAQQGLESINVLFFAWDDGKDGVIFASHAWTLVKTIVRHALSEYVDGEARIQDASNQRTRDGTGGKIGPHTM
jgi:hypothetical protein